MTVLLHPISETNDMYSHTDNRNCSAWMNKTATDTREVHGRGSASDQKLVGKPDRVSYHNQFYECLFMAHAIQMADPSGLPTHCICILCFTVTGLYLCLESHK